MERMGSIQVKYTTGKTASTVTRKRPTGSTPIPKGQPYDKAENRLGRKTE